MTMNASNDRTAELHPLMTPGEVAALFKVDPKTVTRWAAAGLVRSTQTPGGHKRFYRDEIMRLVNGEAAQ